MSICVEARGRFQGPSLNDRQSFWDKASHWTSRSSIWIGWPSGQGTVGSSYLCPLSPLLTLVVGSQVCATLPALYVGSGDLNAVLHACKAGTLPAQSSLWPKTATSHGDSLWTNENTVDLVKFAGLLWIHRNLWLCFGGWVSSQHKILSLSLDQSSALIFFLRKTLLIKPSHKQDGLSPLILLEYLKGENLEQPMSIHMPRLSRPSPSQDYPNGPPLAPHLVPPSPQRGSFLRLLSPETNLVLSSVSWQ